MTRSLPDPQGVPLGLYHWPSGQPLWTLLPRRGEREACMEIEGPRQQGSPVLPILALIFWEMGGGRPVAP